MLIYFISSKFNTTIIKRIKHGKMLYNENVYEIKLDKNITMFIFIAPMSLTIVHNR